MDAPKHSSATKFLDRAPLHPFLFAAYPVLALLAANAAEVEPVVAARPIALALLLAGATFLLSRAALRSTAKGAVLASLFLFLFFSYGHVYALVRQDPALNQTIGRHRYLLPAFGILVLAVLLALRRPLRPWVTRFLNLVALSAVLLALVQVTWAFAGKYSPDQDSPRPTSPLAETLSIEGPRPDVYYIILDAYTRGDVLQTVFEFDNSPFLQSLEDLGFVIADESRSNYAMTRLSVPSSLNMNYLSELGPPLDPTATHAAWLEEAGRHSLVRAAFEDLGYRVVAFESGISFTDWPDSDLYLTRRPLELSDARAFLQLSPFEVLLAQTTMGRLALDGRTWLNRVLRTDIESPNEQHRERILFELDRLQRAPEIEGSKFVFVHIISPHPPYAFLADGTPVRDPDMFSLMDETSHREGYRNQVAFLNDRLLQAVTAILEQSAVEPIIILQGDHGATGGSPEDRMKILNAYYLPGGGSEDIYPGITPVNTFRVIFNRYFGGDLPLLEDRSYFSHADRPFRLEEQP